MQLRVIIEYDDNVNSYSAVCLELPGCVSCGDTEKEALNNIKEAIALYFEPDNKNISTDAKIYKVVY